MINQLEEVIDKLHWVTLTPERNNLYPNERFGEVQHEVHFPSTSLTALTHYIIVNERKYDLFTSKQGHYYIIVSYRLI